MEATTPTKENDRDDLKNSLETAKLFDASNVSDASTPKEESKGETEQTKSSQPSKKLITPDQPSSKSKEDGPKPVKRLRFVL